MKPMVTENNRIHTRYLHTYKYRYVYIYIYILNIDIDEEYGYKEALCHIHIILIPTCANRTLIPSPSTVAVANGVARFSSIRAETKR